MVAWTFFLYIFLRVLVYKWIKQTCYLLEHYARVVDRICSYVYLYHINRITNCIFVLSYLFVGNDHGKWIKVNERKTLLEVLQQKEYIIPAIPGYFLPLVAIMILFKRWFHNLNYLVFLFGAVFFVVSKKSSFYKEFRSGKWSPP